MKTMNSAYSADFSGCFSNSFASRDNLSSTTCRTLNKAKSKKKAEAAKAFGGATAMAIESSNPYRDFRSSMEAMVKSHGGGKLDDWRWLEEMLRWYLRANVKSTHGLIVGAFVDLLVVSASPAASSFSPAKCS
ncbi:hypothetical protein E2562_020763 [Oryza meyeriana var. granulata]|uniref:Transcription repressor n=1 Tax=Oryza meyeriana var. granulata TaxID=110450 RepID=A0A6G1CHN6_9ORYZ|nr:hypothetical protein E2562_020763 [Oryza meyeriana var. granulata]